MYVLLSISNSTDTDSYIYNNGFVYYLYFVGTIQDNQKIETIYEIEKDGIVYNSFVVIKDVRNLQIFTTTEQSKLLTRLKFFDNINIYFNNVNYYVKNINTVKVKYLNYENVQIDINFDNEVNVKYGGNNNK
jgi:hypothetical protein